MSFPKYKYLLTYRYAEIIFDLNSDFCRRYVDKKSRTFDQMIQAARSGKQNIVEAVGESDTTKKNEIKLLGYSKGSYEELLADYEDYCRLAETPIYPKTSVKVMHFRQYGYRLSDLRNLSNFGSLMETPVLPTKAEDAANLMITINHIQTYLLDKQIKALIVKFQKEGGFSEQLLRGRLKLRS
jgi:restriction system protein